MKHWIVTITIIACTLTAIGQEAGFQIQGQGSITIPVTAVKMTNIVFPAPIQTAVKVSRDVLAQKTRGIENVLELKAIRRNFPPTNLSVYDRYGRLYSFVLKYVEDTTVLNYRVTLPDTNTNTGIQLTGLPINGERLRADAQLLAGQRGFMHRSVSSGGLKFELTGIWLKDSLQWFIFSLNNKSPIAFKPSRLHFYLIDAEQINRRATQEWEVTPVYKTQPAVLPGRQRGRFAIAFQPFTVPEGKRLVIKLQGQNGSIVILRLKRRSLFLTRSGYLFTTHFLISGSANTRFTSP